MKWLLASLLLVCCVSAGTLGARAMTNPPTEADMPSTDDRAASQATENKLRPTLELAGPVDPAKYRVGPGDQLLLHIRGQISRDLPMDVGPEGTLLIPDDGAVHVAGRTLAEVRADLLARLHRMYRNVDIDVRLGRPRTFRVYLTGEVRSPGPVLANGSYRVADVLAPGMLLDKASHRNVQVIHADGTRDASDLELFLTTGDATWNAWLRDGDVIQVPPATQFVHVEGAVARPGLYELGQRDSLRTLLRVAGGPLPSVMADRVLVVSFVEASRPESTWVALDDIQSGRINPPATDGERVYLYYIPKYRQQEQAAILGEVQRPGTFPIVEGRTRLSELVAAAQGFLPTADLSGIRVHRATTLAAEKDPELERLLRLSRSELTASEYEVMRTRLAGLREDYRVEWTRLQTNPDLDLLLRDGDVVRVERLVSSIRVDGEVRRPGLLNYISGESVDDVVAQAGGYTNRSWRSKVRVIRAVTGQTLLARNVRTLDPGDFIWVPERPDRTQWEQFKEVLTALASVATIVIAIRSVR